MSALYVEYTPAYRFSQRIRYSIAAGVTVAFVIAGIFITALLPVRPVFVIFGALLGIAVTFSAAWLSGRQERANGAHLDAAFIRRLAEFLTRRHGLTRLDETQLRLAVAGLRNSPQITTSPYMVVSQVLLNVQQSWERTPTTALLARVDNEWRLVEPDDLHFDMLPLVSGA